MTQDETLSILKSGANVFLTGEPGSGKTHTINKFVSWLQDHGIEPSITASTGIAATHIGGFTIHAWSGIGVKEFLSERDVDMIAQHPHVSRRVRNAHILIIDEVSMLSARTLSMVDAVCREIRQRQEPFGGLQIILVGDFFQLPPVSRREVVQTNQMILNSDDERRQFAFQSPAWKAINPIICYLSEQHRQEDAIFLNFLTALRAGSIDESHYELLRTRYSRKPKDGITQLYTHNEDVERINEAELGKIEGDSNVYEMVSRGPEKIVAALKRGCLSPEILALKIGARVMFTRNDPERRYVNGTLGIVTGFDTEEKFPIITTRSGSQVIAEPVSWKVEDNGKVLAEIAQVPLRLAWAITVHKSQGMSLDAAHMDLAQTFEFGQGYVALSRVRTLEGLSLAGLNAKALEVHPDIKEIDIEFRTRSEEAREAFEKMSESELKKMHHNFIRACGGIVEKGKKKSRSRSHVRGNTRAGKKVSTFEATRELVLQKLSLEKIAEERSMTLGTILSHLEKLIFIGKLDPTIDLLYLRPEPKRLKKISDAFKSVSNAEDDQPLLSPVRTLLGPSYSFEELRLARLFLDK